MPNIGLPEIILVVLVLIIFFGSKRMGEMAKSAGEAGKELKKIKKEFHSAKQEMTKEFEEGGAKP